ncbi:SH3 domain-containing protein [Fodinibius sp.]|uniref:SH3 domain-containing protein n=1 Tax=Fodinibius sp. TaxID=1872440 RepID=UPI00356A307F
MYATFTRIAVVVAAFTIAGLGLITGCSGSITWEEARQADTYEAYQSYVEDNPEGEHVEEAQNRADNRYWDAIKEDSTAEAYETYLEEFPDGAFRTDAQGRLNQISSASMATKGRVTGSNVIIRSDHTTESPSAGVVAREGTVVQILDLYSSGNSKEAILKRDVTIITNGNQISLPEGKAVKILSDRSDSVRASFSTPQYGATEATISKNNIEAMSGEKWYKIQTNDDITGWIYGKFIEEL